MKQSILSSANIGKTVFVTPHAVEEARKDFGLLGFPDASVRSYVEENLRKSTFITETASEKDGKIKIDRLFSYNRMIFILDRYDDVVITCYVRHDACKDIRSKVRELLMRELQQLEDTQATIENEIVSKDMERAILEGIAEATKDSRIRYAVYEMDRDIERLRSELDHHRLDKSRVAKGIATYM